MYELCQRIEVEKRNRRIPDFNAADRIRFHLGHLRAYGTVLCRRQVPGGIRISKGQQLFSHFSMPKTVSGRL
jgi:hypothetical protein